VKNLSASIRTEAEELKKEWPSCDALTKCDDIGEFNSRHKLSERTLAFCFGISKSEAHRLLSIAKLSPDMRGLMAVHKTDYHALCAYVEAPISAKKDELKEKLLNGEIKTHKDVRSFLGEFARKKQKGQ
jgi:hypothetical protein